MVLNPKIFPKRISQEIGTVAKQVHTEQLVVLQKVSSQKHNYRHEALFKDEVISDLGKLEEIMAQEDKPYWAIHELRAAMGVKEDDLTQTLYVNNLVNYLHDERVIITGGSNYPDKYTLANVNPRGCIRFGCLRA